MYDIRKLTIWKEEPQTNDLPDEFEKTEITELNLSVRSFNCLKRGGCDTVGDILRLMENEEGGGLRRLRNLGNRSETEIKENIERLREEYARRPRPVQGNKPRVLVKPARSMWDRDISDFRLSRYALERLQNCGIQKVQDLYATNPKNEPGWYAVRELFGEIAKEV